MRSACIFSPQLPRYGVLVAVDANDHIVDGTGVLCAIAEISKRDLKIAGVSRCVCVCVRSLSYYYYYYCYCYVSVEDLFVDGGKITVGYVVLKK